MRRSFKVTSFALAAVTAFAMAGCASEGDVDRTQPGRIAKSIFTGEWYYRQFVTDVPANTAIDMIGSQGGMDRIRWKITENMLVGYRAYASIPGTNNEFTKGENDLQAPIAAFAIISHFDVKRSYNTATGEQTNVIYEDTSDRPWYDRDYIRVDWTRNNALNIQTYTEWVGATPESYIPETQDELDPNRGLITPDYIDVTTRYHVDAGYCSPPYGTWYESTYCSPAGVTVRSSFMKISAANAAYIAVDANGKQTYEPLEFRDGTILKDDAGKIIPSIDLNAGMTKCTPQVIAQLGPSYSVEEDCTPGRVDMFAKFGFFRTERSTYDRDFDATLSGKIFLANRWNLWDPTTPSKDAAGNPVPATARKTRQVTYYLNTHYPEDLFPVAQMIGAQYNKGFKDTVAAMRLTADGNGRTQEEIDAERATLPDIYFVKQNSCNLKSFSVDQNDPRFANSDFSFVPTPSTRDWLNAPTRTEIKRNVMARLKRAGMSIKDDLSDVTPANLERFCTAIEDVTLNEEDPADRFVWQRLGDLRFSFINWIDRDQPAGPLGFGPSDPDPLTGEIINANANVYGAAMDTYAASAVEMVQVLNGDITLADLLQGADILNVVTANADKRKEAERKVFDPIQLEKIFATLPRPEELQNMKEVGSGYFQRRLERIKGTELEMKLVTEDIAMLDPTYKKGDPITKEVIERASPMNWALRDATNSKQDRWKKAMNLPGRNTCLYLAEFADDSIAGWALEQKMGNKTRAEMLQKAREDIFLGLTLHEVGHTVGLRHNFEGSTDALNYFDEFWQIRQSFPRDQWNSKKITEFGYSTVMDYGAKFNADVHGLGKYDYAALKFGYGQLVETFPTTAIATAGAVLKDNLFVANYEDIPKAAFLKNIDGIKNRLTVPYASEVEAFRQDLMAGRAANTREVPYRFCSDEYNGSLTCKTWDEGASQAEIVQSAVQQYRNHWYFTAFKRDRNNWSPSGYMNRISSRYFQHFSTAFQYFYYYGRYYQNSFFGQDLARAAVDGMNTLNEVLATPNTGEYCLPKSTVVTTEPNVFKAYSAANCDTTKPKIQMSMFTGAKPFYHGFDDEYYWDFTRVGAMYDKLMALRALTDSQATFYRVDTFGDQRQYTINYYRSWRDPMINLLEGLVLNKSSQYGGTVDMSTTTPKYVPPVSIDYANATTGLMPNTTAPRLASTVNYTIQLYTMMYSMALLNNTLDDQLDISHYMKIAVKGSADDLAWNLAANDPKLAEFTDPRTQVTYRAVNTADNRSVAFKLVKEAADYLAGEYRQYETAYLAAPTNPTAISNYQYVQSTLSSKLATMDDMRLFNDYYASGQE